MDDSKWNSNMWRVLEISTMFENETFSTHMDWNDKASKKRLFSRGSDSHFQKSLLSNNCMDA